MPKQGGRWNHVFADLRKEYSDGLWGAINSFLCHKDGFLTETLLLHTLTEKMGVRFGVFLERGGCNNQQKSLKWSFFEGGEALKIVKNR